MRFSSLIRASFRAYSLPLSPSSSLFRTLCSSIADVRPHIVTSPSRHSSSHSGTTSESDLVKLPTSENFRVTIAPSGLATLTITRPAKKNAFTLEMYTECGKIMKQLGSDDRVRVLAITGQGDFFTSGNDLSNNLRYLKEGLSESEVNAGLDYTMSCVKPFLASFYQFPKFMVALANGPGMGVGLTMLAHCDLVLAARNASFSTPFTRFGIVPEAGSSYLFPLFFGRSRASRALILGERISAEQGLEWGLVSHVLSPLPEFHTQAAKFLDEQILSLPPNALRLGRNLLHGYDRDKLERAIGEEVVRLRETWLGPEVRIFINKFFSKSKGK